MIYIGNRPDPTSILYAPMSRTSDRGVLHEGLYARFSFGGKWCGYR
jgi:hypothetical protein